MSTRIAGLLRRLNQGLRRLLRLPPAAQTRPCADASILSEQVASPKTVTTVPTTGMEVQLTVSQVEPAGLTKLYALLLEHR